MAQQKAADQPSSIGGFAGLEQNYQGRRTRNNSLLVVEGSVTFNVLGPAVSGLVTHSQGADGQAHVLAGRPPRYPSQASEAQVL